MVAWPNHHWAKSRQNFTRVSKHPGGLPPKFAPISWPRAYVKTLFKPLMRSIIAQKLLLGLINYPQKWEGLNLRKARIANFWEILVSPLQKSPT